MGTAYRDMTPAQRQRHNESNAVLERQKRIDDPEWARRKDRLSRQRAIERDAQFDRRKHLKRHGLTIEQYEAMLALQDGQCAICGAGEPGGRNGGWYVDHDHRHCPGKWGCSICVRSLLCHLCNIGMGNFHDDPVLLETAARYLRSHGVS